jgi:hypothetical protein
MPLKLAGAKEVPAWTVAMVKSARVTNAIGGTVMRGLLIKGRRLPRRVILGGFKVMYDGKELGKRNTFNGPWPIWVGNLRR